MFGFLSTCVSGAVFHLPSRPTVLTAGCYGVQNCSRLQGGGGTTVLPGCHKGQGRLSHRLVPTCAAQHYPQHLHLPACHHSMPCSARHACNVRSAGANVRAGHPTGCTSLLQRTSSVQGRRGRGTSLCVVCTHDGGGHGPRFSHAGVSGLSMLSTHPDTPCRAQECKKPRYRRLITGAFLAAYACCRLGCVTSLRSPMAPLPASCEHKFRKRLSYFMMVFHLGLPLLAVCSICPCWRCGAFHFAADTVLQGAVGGHCSLTTFICIVSQFRYHAVQRCDRFPARLCLSVAFCATVVRTAT